MRVWRHVEVGGKRGMVVVSGIVCAVTLALTDAVPPAAATPRGGHRGARTSVGVEQL